MCNSRRAPLHALLFIAPAMLATASSARAQEGACPKLGELVINEIAYRPSKGAFIELKGPPGASLECVELRFYNGGTSGNDCAMVVQFAFTSAHIIGPSGYFTLADFDGDTIDVVTTKADLQNGPDGISLWHKVEEETWDSLAYVGPMDGCVPPVREGELPAPSHVDGQSIGRSPDGKDTGQNGYDFVVCQNPTPGEENDCPLPQPCPNAAGQVVINEIVYTPTAASFIELKGTPGLSLHCLQLDFYNGGSDGSQCAKSSVFAFGKEHVIGESGYFVLATEPGEGVGAVSSKAKLQLGPDGLALNDRVSGQRIDSLAYGGPMGGCEPPVSEGGTFVAGHVSGQSLARFPDGADSNNTSADFVVCDTPSLGQENDCNQPEPCPEDPDVLINEIVYTPTASTFIELKGEPGTPLHCLRLDSFNGGSDGSKCDKALVYAFSAGQKIGETGYFVLGYTEGAGVDVVTTKANLQVGPDGLALAHIGSGEFVDSVAYGGPMDGCTMPVREGEAPAPGHKSAESIARVPDGIDTDENGEDWVVCAPTIGEANDCAGGGGGGGGGGDACVGPKVPLRFREVAVGPAADAFIEIVGPANVALDCHAVVAYNGANDGCAQYQRLSLTGLTMPSDGVLLIATAAGSLAEVATVTHTIGDLQNGPDAVAIWYEGGGPGASPEVVDSLVYGASLGACTELGIGDGTFVKSPANGQSVFRCNPDAEPQGSAFDFQVCATPNPGGEPLCSCAFCPAAPEPVVINELQTTVSKDAFIELFGPQGTALGCYVLIAYNGGTSATDCKPYNTINLSGSIGESGYFVLAPEGGSRAPLADALYKGSNIQAGPDALALLYYPTGADPIIVDSVVYKAALPACADIGIGEGEKPAPEPKKDRSITRCGGKDTNDNVADWAGCSKPSPGEDTTCTCAGGSGTAPPGGGASSPGGCRTSATQSAWPWALGGLLLAGAISCRRRRGQSPTP